MFRLFNVSTVVLLKIPRKINVSTVVLLKILGKIDVSTVVLLKIPRKSMFRLWFCNVYGNLFL
jgi:hypothetical protein